MNRRSRGRPFSIQRIQSGLPSAISYSERRSIQSIGLGALLLVDTLMHPLELSAVLVNSTVGEECFRTSGSFLFSSQVFLSRRILYAP